MVHRLAGTLVAALTALVAATALGSQPAAQTIASPAAAGETTTVTWEGTIPAGSNPASDCDDPDAEGVDRHAIDVAVPDGLYDRLRVTAVFEIEWTSVTGDPRTSDQVVTVIDPSLERADGTGAEEGSARRIGNANGIGTREVVRTHNLRAARYEALACGFVSAVAQPYRGTLTLTAQALDGERGLASAPDEGLAFSASTPADPQRREIEPIIEIDPAGVSYTCGPAGLPGVDYMQVSLDKGGDQFHLMGEPPQGRPNPLVEGGDCGLATGFTPNEDGVYPFAFTGLGPLTNFPTAASPDNGRTLNPGNSNNAVAGVDRQWMTFVDDNAVLLSYNRQQPRQIVVQRSNDGGQTYLPAQVPASPLQPRFPGPLRSLPAKFNWTGAANGRVAYFAFDDPDHNVNLAVSVDGGETWTNCRAATANGVGTFFPVADHDVEGNIYVGYGENTDFHMYVTALDVDNLDECDEPALTATSPPTKNPGFTTPVQVDRDPIRSTVFPWLAAGGEPGRVAMSYYGTPSEGDPNQGDFKGTWHVYVSQSLNMIKPDGSANPDATFAQVQATTHPLHYDSICLNGTLCDASGGDRSLADFFSIDHNPVTDRLQIAYSQSYKRPNESGGSFNAPTVVLVQRAGPGHLGGDADPDPRPVARRVTEDAAGDAIREYSTVAPTPKATRNVPAMDFREVRVDNREDGGLRITMRVADLSDVALGAALPGGEPHSTAQSLLWVLRWVNGFEPAAATARWNPEDGFSYGYNGFQTASSPECTPDFTCQVYRGDQPIAGRVDQAAGTIVLEVPRARLKTLEGPTGPGQRPKEVAAGDGDRLYDATAWSMGNTLSPTQDLQGLMMPFDNTSGMDIVLGPQPEVVTPPRAPAPVPGPPLGPPTTLAPPPAPGPIACQASAGFRSVSARPRGRGVRLSFRRRAATPVSVDVFQQSRGRRILGERLVARFRNQTKAFTWNGRSRGRRRVSDGFFFARFSTRGARVPVDVRRVTLERRGGRFVVRRPFHRRASCGLLRLFKLTRPVFGGRRRRTLGITFSVDAPARVTVTVRRGRRVVRRYRARTVAGRRLVRLALRAATARRRGVHTVELRAVRGTQRVRAVLVARRL